MKRFYAFILVVICLTANSVPSEAATQPKYDADFALSARGILNGLLNGVKTAKYKVGIAEGADQYIYSKSALPDYESFPLQLGDGNYSVKFYENTVDTKYKVIYNKSAYVDVTSETDLYLISNQQVKWTATDDAIVYAKSLINSQAVMKGVATLSNRQKLDVIYQYIIKNMTYDYEKIKTLNSDYVPDIDVILAAKKGICFDYSVLFASMLRSQGIPSKLIKGYSTTTDVYHAWNEVYLADEKRWIIIDTTYDAYMAQHKQKYNMEKALADYTKKYEF